MQMFFLIMQVLTAGLCLAAMIKAIRTIFIGRRELLVRYLICFAGILLGYYVQILSGENGEISAWLGMVLAIAFAGYALK